jgi:transcriptional regulator with XRE-family HTH domain
MIDALEDELVRRLGGSCTLSLGPAEEANVLEAPDPTMAIVLFCESWGISTTELAMKAGISAATVRSAMSGRRSLTAYTRKRIATTINRITSHPTIPEFLRHRRIKSGYTKMTAATLLGVTKEVLNSWETRTEVPPRFRHKIMRLYNIATDLWDTTITSVLDMLAPASYDELPEWGKEEDDTCLNQNEK